MHVFTFVLTVLDPWRVCVKSIYIKREADWCPCARGDKWLSLFDVWTAQYVVRRERAVGKEKPNRVRLSVPPSFALQASTLKIRCARRERARDERLSPRAIADKRGSKATAVWGGPATLVVINNYVHSAN